MHDKIEQAFVAFQAGQRPDHYRPAQHWYVCDAEGGRYPAKAIYALAFALQPNTFQTKQARRDLVTWGYTVIDARKDTER